jgi:hypothetical protein
MIQKIKKLIPLILVLSLITNVVLLVYPFDSKLKTNSFCAGFKEQASARIRTYYSDGSLDNIYPDEIFYSKKKESCIAVWSGYQTNLASNGHTVIKVIFDAITNKDIFSDSIFQFNDLSLNNNEMNNQVRSSFDRTLEELR